jgi:hypothetical protein
VSIHERNGLNQIEKQIPVMPGSIDHPQAKELEQISQILEDNATIYDLPVQDLSKIHCVSEFIDTCPKTVGIKVIIEICFSDLLKEKCVKTQ